MTALNYMMKQVPPILTANRLLFNVTLVYTSTFNSTHAQPVLIPIAWIAQMPGSATSAMMDSTQFTILKPNTFVNSKQPVILAFTSMPTLMNACLAVKAATIVSQLITAMNAIKDGSVNKVKI